ncbi:MAG: SMC-Scp complex subunit ScpB [Nanoarchaeota archaeon]
MQEDLRNKVEALLFASGKNMDVEQIASVLVASAADVMECLSLLQKEYESRDSALRVYDEGAMWKIHVRDRYLSVVQKIVADTELPKTVLETLAVIAYKGPMLQSDVIKTRTQQAYEHITLLQDMGFVTKEKEGRSFRLKVTGKFFEYFEIDKQDDLRRMLAQKENARQARPGVLLDAKTKDPDRAGQQEHQELPPQDRDEKGSGVEGMFSHDESAEPQDEAQTVLRKVDEEIDEMLKESQDGR